MTKQRVSFDPKTFLTTVGVGRTLVSFRKGQTIFTQGEAADSLFVIQMGRVKVSVKSQAGKEAVLDILSDADFVGKDSMAGQPSRTASANAITDCSLLRITKKAMLLALARQVKLGDVFWKYVLASNIQYQQDLVEQHCNTSEKRLAHILVRLAHYDRHGGPETTVPKISKGFALEIFIGAGELADEHEAGIDVADAKDDLGAGRGEVGTFDAGQHALAKLGKGGGFRRVNRSGWWR